MICDQELDPNWQPVCAEEHPDFEATESACDALGALLEKDHLERPIAYDAMRLTWFQSASRVLQIEAVSDKYVAAGMPIERARGSSQQIPMRVRLKAARAAARAPVSISKEQHR